MPELNHVSTPLYICTLLVFHDGTVSFIEDCEGRFVISCLNAFNINAGRNVQAIPLSRNKPDTVRQLRSDLLPDLSLFLSEKVQQLSIDLFGVRPVQAVRSALDNH